MSITFLPNAYFIGPHLKQVSKVFEPQHMFKSGQKQMFHRSITNLGVIYEYTQHMFRWLITLVELIYLMSNYNICFDGRSDNNCWVPMTYGKV